MGLKVTNNAFGTLNAGINDSATTIVLTAGQGSRFPTLSAGDYFYATLIDTSNNLEIVKVTARSTDTMTVVRGQDNTTARAYSTNDRFELRPTAALFNEKANDADVTTSLAAKVNLAGDSMTGQLNVHNSTQSNYASSLAESVSRATVKLRTHSTDSTLTTFGGITGGDAYIQRSNGSGTSEYDIRLNPFGGRVLIPNQPAFSAALTRSSSSTWNSMGNGVTIIFDDASTNELFNRGGHYNASNGRFTAPVAGVYVFSFSSNIAGGGDFKNVQLRVNGNNRRENYNQSDNSWDLLSWTHTIELSAGDYVTCVSSCQSTATFDANAFGSASQWTFFNGYLLG